MDRVVRGGCDDAEDRVRCNGSGVLMVLDDDYGSRWEICEHAARWTPASGWGRPFE